MFEKIGKKYIDKAEESLATVDPEDIFSWLHQHENSHFQCVPVFAPEKCRFANIICDCVNVQAHVLVLLFKAGLPSSQHHLKVA